MIPKPFGYLRARSVDQALAALSENGDEAKLLAGGQSLLPLLKLRLAEPQLLVDIARIPELQGLRPANGTFSLGPLVTYRQLETDAAVRQQLPLLAETAGVVADPQVRNRGTIGGSLAHGDPASDIPAAVLALEGRLHLAGPAGTREVDAAEFFLAPLLTDLAADEILVEIRCQVPPPGTGSAYLKLDHHASHYAVVGVAAMLTLDGRTCTRARLAVTGAGDRALRLRAVEAALEGQSVDDATLTAAATLATAELEPADDFQYSAEYRAHVTRVLTARALQLARQRAMA